MPETSPLAALLEPRTRPKTRIGLVSGGLGAYWDQFPDLLPRLRESAAYVATRLAEPDVELIDAGFVSDAPGANAAAQVLRAADCDLLVVFAATYLTASMVLPIAQRAGAPVLVIDLQPTASMDHPTFTTGDWLAYCGQCPIPEIANVFRRAGIDFRSVSGHLRQDTAWERIGNWVAAAAVRGRLRTARHGLMGHLYPGMLDVSTDPLNISARFGSHVEILEFDDLRERVAAVTDAQVAARVELAKTVFRLDASVNAADLSWAAKVSVGLDALVSDFGLDSLAYYHRGLAGEIHERLGAGMILGASLLTARGIPMAGEYELRTSLAMLAADTLGAGGSFTEIQALDFDANVVEMGHDGPAHLRISSGQPLLRGLGVYHGKRGWGVSVEFDVRHGAVTCFGIGEDRDGSYSFITSEGTVTAGPLLGIGNTTSRVDFGTDPGLWVDDWSATGVGHHWALCTGHRSAQLAAAASLLGIEHRTVGARS
ncbi:L-fucose/L-arabinose isomerase family protein [Paeniglutamicibacter psychrophenolicus]|uniref:L-arabinose isomerase n=1 Tax=Paeniglutamicibacter psychrophenolicus TaxID=257454 RepID=A0ABS4W935_9MICC|nr:L-fucose/L-arabinose isomerase family protein [Paeniglutamicibacter psychrophenolicus]MBP2372707.1 L-arabinose isomerase [Paeniglutamicibacter psychrophenolicus]